MAYSKIRTWNPGSQDLESWDPWTMGSRTLRSGTLGIRDPETRDSATLYPGTLGPWTRDPHTQDPWTEALEHGSLTPRTLEMSPWDLEIATLRPRILRAAPWELNLWCILQVSGLASQIDLTLIVKQILIIKKLGASESKT